MTTTFIISGSLDESPNVGPVLGSYKATVYGSISIGDTSRTPLAVIRNNSTGSVDVKLNEVRVSISPKSQTQQNDVCFLLGALASGSVSGSAFTPTPVDPTYPASVAGVYGATITGPTLHDPTDGFLVQAQSKTFANETGVIANVNDQLLTDDPVVVAPGYSYVVSISELNVVNGATVFAYIAEFSWSEVA